MRARGWSGLAAALATLVALAAPAEARGQSVEEALRTLGEENARPYSHPVSSGFAAGMNSGWFQGAEVLGPLKTDVQVKVMGSLVPEEDETFEPILPGSFTFQGVTYTDPYRLKDGSPERTPTAVGTGEVAVITPDGALRQAILDEGLEPADFEFAFPEGFDVPAVPMAALQGSVGLLAGTEVSVRWVPSVEIDEDVGSVEAFGVGGKHSLSQWFGEAFPLDLAVEGGWQSFDVGDYVEADATHVSLVASKELAVLTLFGSAGIEDSSVDVSYVLESPVFGVPDQRISFTDEGDNSGRVTAGFNLDLIFLQLNASYSVADYSVVSAGLGLAF